MNQSEKRIAIAEACGWTEIIYTPYDPMPPKGREYKESNWGKPIPDYFNDLNAMHEAEKVLNKAYLWNRYKGWLLTWMTEPICATAAQRAEAFGHALNLWK